MYVYGLVRCELDEQNRIQNHQLIGFFARPEYIIGYLTKDGKSSCTLSLLGHNDTDIRYIKDYIGSPNAIIVVTDICEGNPLLGIPSCKDELFYYTELHEVRDYGFFTP